MEPGLLDRGGAGLDGEARGGLALAGIAALADAGAFDDPLVARVDPPLEVGVGDALLGERGAPACDAGPHAQCDAQPGDRLPFTDPLAGVHEHPDQSARERARDRRRGARSLEHADSLAAVDVRAVGHVDGAEGADRRGDDHALGNEQASRRGRAWLPWSADLRERRGDVVGGRDPEDGDVGDGALGEAGEHRAVPDLEQRRGAEGGDRLH